MIISIILLMTIFLILSLLSNTLLIIISVYLFIWRRSVNDTQTSIVPSQLLTEFNKNHSKLLDLSGEIKNFLLKTLEVTDKNSQTINKIDKYLSILTKKNSEKDEEIKRLKEGYDTKIFEGFITRFLRAYKNIEDDIEELFENKGNEKCVNLLSHLKSVLKEALLDCGLEEFSPKKGQDYRKTFGVSETSTICINTNLENNHMKIARVKSSGFKIKNHYGDKVIKPSVVEVYIFKKRS